MEKTNVSANKELVKKFFENFEKGKLDAVENILSDNFKLNFPGSSKPLTKTEAIEKMEEFNTAFPDLKFTIQLQLTDGEYVVTRHTMKGTQKGEFNGIPATNKKVTANGISIQRIVNNKIVEDSTEFDAFGLIQQLGGLTEFSKRMASQTESTSY